MENEKIASQIEEASKQVVVGGLYSHYKDSNHHYRVIDLGVQEATEKLCVIYKPEYGGRFTFVRDLDHWLEPVMLVGVEVPRFKLIE